MKAARTADATGRVRDRITELVRVRAGDLVANPSNWRRHPERQRAALEGVLREIGYADALLARRIGQELVLIDGHLRQSIDPDQMVPVLVLDVDEREADTILATLDPLAALAVPDAEALHDLIGRVQTSNEAVSELLGSLAAQASLPPPVLIGDPDDLGPPPQTRTRPGDLWLLGDHRLLCADAREPESLERVMAGEHAKLVWTDPPYGVNYVGKTTDALKIRGDVADGLPELLRRTFAAVGAVLAPGAAIYCCHPAGPEALTFLEAFRDAGWRLHQGLVWVKDSMVLGHGDYHYRHEPIAFGYAPGDGRRGRGARGWYGGNGEHSVFEIPRPKASREHPTMKPVELIERCLANSSAPGAAVLDPFAGSASTLIACELSSRRGFGVEIDPRYCDVAVSRWERLTERVAARDEAHR